MVLIYILYFNFFFIDYHFFLNSNQKIEFLCTLFCCCFGHFVAVRFAASVVQLYLGMPPSMGSIPAPVDGNFLSIEKLITGLLNDACWPLPHVSARSVCAVFG